MGFWHPIAAREIGGLESSLLWRPMMAQCQKEQDVVEDLQAGPDQQAGDERGAGQQDAPKEGTAGPCGEADDVGDRACGGSLVRRHDRHDIGLAGRYVHLDKSLAKEE